MRYVLVLLTVLLSGCATSYKPLGWGGGYSDSEVGENKYIVRFSGNGYTKAAKAENYAFQRAREVCVEKGKHNFELISKNSSTRVFETGRSISCTSYGSGNVQCSEDPGMTFHKPDVELLISCRD
jgi:hypothetical protein